MGSAKCKATEKIFKFQVPVVPSKLAVVRRALTEIISTHRLKLGGGVPKVNVESSPERQARYQAYGALTEVLKEIAQVGMINIEEDCMKTLTVKWVKEDESKPIIGGINFSGRLTWNDDTLAELGWNKNDLEMNMRK